MIDYYAKLAADLADECKAEDGKKPRPKVGAVAVGPDGDILATAYRGERVDEEQGDGDHAEFILLQKKLAGRSLKDAVIYTTLEPCTRRGKTKEGRDKVPCAKHLVRREVKRVVIGMLDPNPDITGKGYVHLVRARIEVALFPPRLQQRVHKQNAEFSDPYRRFDDVYASEIIAKATQASCGLLAALRGFSRLLRALEALPKKSSELEQLLNRERASEAALSVAFGAIGTLGTDMYEHLRAIRYKDKTMPRLHEELLRHAALLLPKQREFLESIDPSEDAE